MFKLFFILSFFLSFTQVSLATTCDRGDFVYGEVEWAERVIEFISFCEDRSSYNCVYMVRACEAIAQEILAEVERERQEKEYNKYLAETTEEEREEDRKKEEARKEAEDLKMFLERNPELKEYYQEK